MSYQKKIHGQYVQVAGLGADDPWADAASGTVAPVTGGVQSEGGGFFDFLFGGSKPTTSSTAPKPAPAPSAVSQVGAGIGAFLKGLSAPAPAPAAMPLPIAQTGMSSTTKLALIGGAGIIAVLLLTRD